MSDAEFECHRTLSYQLEPVCGVSPAPQARVCCRSTVHDLGVLGVVGSNCSTNVWRILAFDNSLVGTDGWVEF